MPKTRQQKETEVKKLTDSFKNSKSAVFSTFNALNVADNQELRNKLREQKVEFIVTKKTFLKKVFKDLKMEGIDLTDFQGNVAVAFGTEDEVAPAKIISQFAKNHEQLIIKSGLLDGQVITLEKVTELSKLPAKLEMLAKTVATIGAPLSGLVNVLAGNLRGLVNVLNSIKENK